MRRFPRALLATAAALMVSAAPVAAAPAVDGIFDIQGDAGVQNNGQLTVGPDGNIWVALDTAVAKVTPDGTVTVFGSAELNNTLGTPKGGITSAGGFIWVSQTPGGGKEAIVKIPPAAPGTATGVAVAGINAGATAMTTGPDGNVWVGLLNSIVQFRPTDPPVATPFPVANLDPKGMTSASDGTLWVTDIQNGRLLNLTTDGANTPYIVGGQPQFVAAGPSGQIAFSNPNNAPQQIGLLSPGGMAQLLDRPAGSDPFGVTFGNDGAYWIAEFAGNRLARVTTDGQLTTLAGFPDAPLGTQGPRQITAGPNNTLWATIDKPGDAPNSKIARITGVEPPPVTNPGPTPGDQTPTNTPPPPPPPPPDTTAPQLSLVTVTRTGTTLRFALTEAGTARAVLARAAAGKRRGKACVKPTRKLRKAKRCTRFVRVKIVSAPAIAGQNAIRLPKQTRPGRYRVVITATDAAGNRGTPVTRAFTVNKKRK